MTARKAEQNFEPRVRPGTRVRVSYTAEVMDLDWQKNPDHLAVQRRPAVGYPIYIDRDTDIEILPPDWAPGTIVRANGIEWCVRKSNAKDSLRVMPVDLSGKNRTLPIEDFYARYPAAKVVRTPKAF